MQGAVVQNQMSTEASQQKIIETDVQSGSVNAENTPAPTIPSEDAAAATTSTNVDGEGKASSATAAAPGAQPTAASLYVGDLLAFVAEKDLFEFFRPIGEVASVRVCRDAVTRRSLGYAYVNFANYEDGERALVELNYRMIAGQPCRLMWSQRDPSVRKSGVANVFVKNLDVNINTKGLYEVFKVFGNILSCKVKVAEGNESGFGFVQFEHPESAQAAIDAFHGVYFNDRRVHVGFHVPRASRESTSASRANEYTNVYVKNIPKTIDDSALRAMFETHGEILSAVVQMDENNRSKGFGFVNFATHSSAVAAVQALNGTEIEGKTLCVTQAQKKTERAEALRSEYESRCQERMQKYQNNNLYVKHLDESVDDEKLRSIFEQFGTIVSTKVMSENGTSRCFGFVCFSTPEEATRAAAEMHGKIVDTKPLYVAVAQRKEHRRAQLQSKYASSAQMHPHFQVGTYHSQMMGPSGMYQAAPIYYPQVPVTTRTQYGYPNMMRPRWQQQQAQQQQAQQGTQIQGTVGDEQQVQQQDVQSSSNQQMQYGMNMHYQQNQMRMPRAHRGQQMNMPQQQGQHMYHSHATNQRTQGGVHNQRMHRPMHPREKFSGPRSNGMGYNSEGQYNQTANTNRPPQSQNRNNQQAPRSPPPVQRVSDSVPATIEASTNAAPAPAEDQKQMLGEALYHQIALYNQALAPKITGMLLEVGTSEVMRLLDSPSELEVRVHEAAKMLEANAAAAAAAAAASAAKESAEAVASN